MVRPTIILFGNNLQHPFLDRGETKTFINNVLEYYNITNLDEYKTSPKQPHLKAVYNILITNNATQSDVDNMLIKRKN
jgi:hypothetical protein